MASPAGVRGGGRAKPITAKDHTGLVVIRVELSVFSINETGVALIGETHD